MKTLYLDCGMGAAGDMLTAALLELTEDPGEAIRELNALGIPDVEYTAQRKESCGILGTHVRVLVAGKEEGTDLHAHDHSHDTAHGQEYPHEHTHDAALGHAHSHEHDHADHEHIHDGSGSAHHHDDTHALADIEHIIDDHIHADGEVKENARRVFRILAEAESTVHGRPVPDIHFHEVGTMDAVADITAVCYLIRRLGIGRILASPVHVGRGRVKCAHGILPVPAPATAQILKGVPIYSIPEIEGELCTPTGAALLKAFVSEFGTMPVMTYERIGYGLGTKEFPVLSCVRAFLGELTPAKQ